MFPVTFSLELQGVAGCGVVGCEVVECGVVGCGVVNMQIFFFGIFLGEVLMGFLGDFLGVFTFLFGTSDSSGVNSNQTEKYIEYIMHV